MKTTKLIFICFALIIVTSAVCAAAEVSANWWGAAPGQKPVVTGTVANVSATNIAVQTKEGVKPFTVNPKTRVRVQGNKATIADVRVGDPVSVHFKLVQNNVPTALQVVVPKPRVSGKITSIQGNAITLKSKLGEAKVLITDKTKIASKGYEGALADLRIGFTASAQGTIADGVTTADVFQFQPAVVKGAVTAIDANTITVKTVRQLTIIAAPSAKTAVLVRPRVGPNKPGTMADVKVGEPVNIGIIPTKGNSSPLLWVEVLTGS